MKRLYILFSMIIVLFIIILNCQQTGGGGGSGGRDNDSPSKWESQLKKIAYDAFDNDSFGHSVSISGDYAIVGTQNKDNGRGAAYIYHRTGTNTWDEGFKIMALDAADNDLFGCSVSISGDYAIVGAYNVDGAGINRGAAYIFYRIGANLWDEGFKITAFDAADEDYFGCSVSISGDYAIVGAYREDGIGTNRGAVYIYRRIGTNIWGDVTKEIAFDAADGDHFGRSVSISGDYAIIGAPGKDIGGADRGVAYVFHRTGTNIWDDGIRVIGADSVPGDEFGHSVSISGDYAIVGAYAADSFIGAAYIYHRIDVGENNWVPGTKLEAFDAEDGDNFGISLSISGDYAIVGAFCENGSITKRGAAYIYHRIDTNWNTGIKILASDAGENDRFGNSVSISGDYAIIGAYGEDGAGINRGAAYIIK